MTPLTPEQELKLNPPKRRDISELEAWANRDMRPVVSAQGYDGRHCGGMFGKDDGVLDGLGWMATQDLDGQIELSASFSHKRPNNFEIMRLFGKFGWTYFREESRAVGRVRHFVVQRGITS